MNALLDVAIIAKNEAGHLPNCLDALEPLKPVLGSICVYDTGSTDGTQEIVRAHRATVQQGYWDDDFARAKNEAIAMCSSKWVLVVDADDRVSCDVAQFKRRLLSARPDTDCFDIDVDVSIGSANESTMRSARIINRHRMCYTGIVHEHVVRCDGAVPRSAAMPRECLFLTHVGYDLESLPAKIMRNFTLADKAVERATAAGNDEALGRALIDRARSRQVMDQSGEALDDYARLADMELPDRYFTWGLEKYCEALVEAGRLDDAETVLARLEHRGTEIGFLTYWRAGIALGRHDPATALELIRQVDLVQESVQTRISTAGIIDLRMRAAVQAGENDEALACCLQLMVAHRSAAGCGRLLMLLWHPRPLDSLADILREAPEDFLPEIVAELRGAGGEEGHRVADMLVPARV